MADWVTDVVNAQAGNATAIISTDASWSGRQLLGHAAAQAEWIAGLGLPDGAPLPALLDTSGEALALVIAGAATRHPLALLSPRMTVRELAACVKGLPSPLIAAQSDAAEIAQSVADDCGRSAVLLNGSQESAAGLPTPAAGDMAMILHTSGTTGNPKPVYYRHDRLARRVAVNAPLQQFGPDAVFATASPFHHIAGIGNLAVAIAAGTAVVLMPRFSVDNWRALADVGVTHVLAVPTMIELLLREGALALPSLRFLQYGAAPIHPETLRLAMAALPDVDFLTLYGQTEGSPITALTPEDHRAAASGKEWLLHSVGRAVPGAEVRIEGAGHDGIGEVTARGSHLFMSSDDGWLRTGDIGRIDEEGYLYLVGRRGDKIIRGGENVYPAEVENVLAEHPEVAEAAVVGLPDQVFGQVVTAFIVAAHPTAPPDPDELRAFARRSLAGFKVPQQWRFVPELPRNATGKLERQRLLPGWERPPLPIILPGRRL
jgi:acyl-CoA synthetase (AMP-forming)/AMP-acid ligase II